MSNFGLMRDKGFTRYPNLAELYDYHPYREPAMCDHAGIEMELLYAVLHNGMPCERIGLSEGHHAGYREIQAQKDDH